MGCGGSSVGKKSGIYFTQNVSGRTGLYHMQTPQSKVEEVLSPKALLVVYQ
jgi:hypothetical protein